MWLPNIINRNENETVTNDKISNLHIINISWAHEILSLLNNFFVVSKISNYVYYYTPPMKKNSIAFCKVKDISPSKRICVNNCMAHTRPYRDTVPAIANCFNE